MAVKALAHSPLTTAAVRELLEIPTLPPVPDDDFIAHSEKVLGWGFTDLVCDADLTRHGHVLSYDVDNPLGDPAATLCLVFGEAYPYQPDMPDDEQSLTDNVRAWAETPGWRFCTDPGLDGCETVLAEAALSVSEVLGCPPQRTVRTDNQFSLGPHALCRIWCTGDHAVVLGPQADEGPYGYLTHFALVLIPWPSEEELPADDAALGVWVRERIDW
ncbi:hypothetical protein ACIQ7Q_23675 [Streptomyces sp. NPDC096176]|uniref:hypothetical protein n=1 Tax=Streptomyces sp. NPDC096176 TaxID=3366079 RepID=UPI0037F26BF1